MSQVGNRYVYEMVRAFQLRKLIGSCPNDAKLTDKLALDALFEATTITEDKAIYIEEYCRERGITDINTMCTVAKEGVQNTFTVGLCEIMAFFDGVLLSVQDTDLVEALMRTDIDAVVGDVYMPFPVMEIAFPKGILISDGKCQLGGVVVVDMRQVDFVKRFSKHNEAIKKVVADRDMLPQLMILSNFVATDGVVGISSYILRLKLSERIQELPFSPDMTADEIAVAKAHTRTALALLLYLQSVERHKAMQPVRMSGFSINMPASVAKVDKKRPVYCVRDIVPDGRREGQSRGGHHASPVTHWRRGHMRALRDERFKRDRNNNVRVIFVRPAKICASDDEMVTGQRILAKHENAELL